MHQLSIGKNPPKIVDVMVEIPSGTRNKYEYDKATGTIRLDRVIHSPFHYPADYGFIPETLADDGDPLDALIITDSPTFPGCIVSVRPIGVIHMVDDKGGDEKIIAVPEHHPRYNHIEDMDGISPHLLEEIEHFFEEYKKLEKKHVEIKGFGDHNEAWEIILRTHQAYKPE